MTYLLSYPRSGSTWLRYVLEYLSGRATVGQNSDSSQGVNKFDRPMLGQGTPALIKRHEPSENMSRIVFLVRDFKEAIPRHTGLYGIEGLEGTRDYFDLVNFYEEFKGPKIVIYYEDLVKDPLEAGLNVCRFLRVDAKRVHEFYGELETLRQDCISRYGMSKSKGQLGFHSSRIEGDWNGYVKKNYNYETLKRYL